jgi:carbon monoxide dehydrogenase subunit G
MELVAACFPGATLASADGEEYAGSVRVKLGPIQLTYKGSARIVDKDETAHRATIEASGSAPRSGSTATMLVKATATEISGDRTAVQMDTNLTITGRPAQFGRGVMAEVGNKIIGQFADCLSGKLSGGGGVSGADASGGVSAAAASAAVAGAPGSEGSTGSPSSAASDAAESTGAPVSVAAAGTTTGGAGGRPMPSGETDSAAESPGAAGGAGQAGGPRHSAGYTRSPEPIDLLESAGAPVLKRLLPVLGGLVAVWLLRRVFRRSKAKRLARKASRRAGKALDLARQAVAQDEPSGE